MLERQLLAAMPSAGQPAAAAGAVAAAAAAAAGAAAAAEELTACRCRGFTACWTRVADGRCWSLGEWCARLLLLLLCQLRSGPHWWALPLTPSCLASLTQAG